MPDILDDITLANRALARFGGGAISAFDEETSLAQQVASVYWDIIDHGHVLHGWRWARRTFTLQRLDETPVNGWRYAHDFPPDTLVTRPSALFTNPQDPDTPLRQFLVEDNKVFSQHETLYGTFVVRKSPDLWPPDFRNAMIMWLAAELCVPVSHHLELAADYRRQAIGEERENYRGGLMGRAIAAEAGSSGGIAPLGAEDPLTAAHAPGAGAAMPWHGSF